MMNNAYTVIRKIGNGGFGDVWEAVTSAGIHVAIKVGSSSPNIEETRRVLQGVQTIRRLRHPYLVTLHSYWTDPHKFYIVMELAECSLLSKLEECRNRGIEFPQTELHTHLSEAADALDFLHQENLVHGAISPRTILLLHGHVKVTNYGRIRSLSEPADSPLPIPPSLWAYAPPEAWQGRVHINSDEYALACAYVELRLGHPPFGGPTQEELKFNHLNHLAQLDSLYPLERTVVHKALNKDPNRRFISCLEFVKALTAVQKEKGTRTDIS
jgi:serine/threonine protein kinase